MNTAPLPFRAGCTLVITVLVLLSGLPPVRACTSFAVYGDEPIYGINFDWNPTSIRFYLPETSSRNRGLFTFTWEWAGQSVRSVLMNDGVFCASQELRPTQAGKKMAELAPDELFIHDLLTDALTGQGKDSLPLGVKETIDFLQAKRLTQSGDFCLHTMLADPAGNAAVFEVGAEANEITPISGSILVMTNFPVHKFAGLNYDAVEGAGSDRYKIAWSYIEEHYDSFSVEHAFTALERTAQSNTRCSMVLLPEQSLVYFTLGGNFNQVWVADLRQKTIATHRGFATDYTLDVPPGGLSTINLRAGGLTNPVASPKGLSWQIVVASGGLLLAALLGYLLLGKRLLSKQRLN